MSTPGNKIGPTRPVILGEDEPLPVGPTRRVFNIVDSETTLEKHEDGSIHVVGPFDGGPAPFRTFSIGPNGVETLRRMLSPTLLECFHRAWTAVVGSPEYVKMPWLLAVQQLSAHVNREERSPPPVENVVDRPTHVWDDVWEQIEGLIATYALTRLPFDSCTPVVRRIRHLTEHHNADLRAQEKTRLAGIVWDAMYHSSTPEDRLSFEEAQADDPDGEDIFAALHAAERLMGLEAPAAKGIESVPPNFLRLDGYGDDAQGLRAYTGPSELIVCGIPFQREGAEESGHNCDQMGCGWDHVLARFQLPSPEAMDEERYSGPEQRKGP